MSLSILILLAVTTIIWAIALNDRSFNIKTLIPAVLIGGVANYLIIYLTTIPLILLGIVIIILANTTIALIVSGFYHDRTDPLVYGAVLGAGGVIVILITLAILTVSCAGNLAAIPNVQTSENSTNIIDETHIRMVSYETALWRADKVIGNLGYKVGVYEPDIQWKDDSLVWLVPMDFTSIIKAWSYSNGGTEGYVIISAEDPKAEPVKVTGIQMRYTPNAILNNDLSRHIYFDYPEYKQSSPVFQLDADNNPKWVTLLGQPSIMGLIGYEPKLIVITDPVSGYQESYPIGQQPDWVQRAWSEETAETYIDWWGQYSNGYINSIWEQKDVKVATGGVSVCQRNNSGATVTSGDPDVYLIKGKDNNLYWFSAITTPGKDTSMVGYILCNTQTGKFTFYETPGFYNDIGAAANVQQNPLVAMATGLEIVQPIMYVIDGQEVWIIPVISQTGEQQEVGLVVAKTGMTYVNDNLEDVLSDWQQTTNPTVTTTDLSVSSIQDEINQIRTLLNDIETKIS